MRSFPSMVLRNVWVASTVRRKLALSSSKVTMFPLVGHCSCPQPSWAQGAGVHLGNLIRILDKFGIHPLRSLAQGAGVHLGSPIPAVGLGIHRLRPCNQESSPYLHSMLSAMCCAVTN